MHVRVGTSGFQYPEWRGTFYPPRMAPKAMLAFYAERFATTEVNYTFRRLPAPTTLARWHEETPPGFVFSFKAPQRITHFAKLRGCGDVLRAFAAALTAAGGKCGPVLFQLPPTLACDLPTLRDFLAELPAGLRAAFEFRHASWFVDGTFAALAEHRAALCVAESADLATPRVATADFGYLRLRREDYASGDLADWVKWTQAQPWGEAFVYFKHEATGVGPRFAREFLDRLG